MGGLARAYRRCFVAGAFGCSYLWPGESVIIAKLKKAGKIWLLAFCAGSLAGVAGPNETETQHQERLSWWREARFGMFVHWGPVSLTGKELSWSRANSNTNCPNHGSTPVEVYDNLYKEFNPTNFNAEQWASVAKSAGMNYVVLTAKHCDGFLLWDSKVDSYNIHATPFKRDICAEISRATRRQGLKMGWYFSPMDWRDPDCRGQRNSIFVERMQDELRELLTNYGRIDLLWFDFDGREALYNQPGTYAIARTLQPKIIINNRLDLGVGDKNTEMKSPYADYYTPEQRIGSYDDKRPWETCMTLGTQWSWKPDDKIKTSREVIEILARTAGGDGNLLLNVGPMPDGQIEPRQAQVLKELGEWLTKYGESVYGTRGGPFKPGEYGASTRKGRTIFIHVLKWPDGALRLPPIPARIVQGRLLRGGKIEVRQTASSIEISVPPDRRDATDTIIALKLDDDALKLEAIDVPRFQISF
jgi:alpha-L-fucosidase